MPTLHIVRKIDVQFPLVDEDGRIIRGGRLSKTIVGRDDGSIEKTAEKIIDDVNRSLTSFGHVQIPASSHLGNGGTKTTTATTAIPKSATTRPELDLNVHEQFHRKEQAAPTDDLKSVPRTEELVPAQQPELCLPTSLTSLRNYPSLSLKPPTMQMNTDRETHPPKGLSIASIPPPTQLTKNVVTQDGIVGNNYSIIGNAGASAQMVMSNANSSAKAKRASLSVSNGISHAGGISIESSRDNRVSRLPPRKRLKYNYSDAIGLLMEEEKAASQKNNDASPSHTGEKTETPVRGAVCTQEECDMAAALMSLPSKTPSSPSNISSSTTTIADGASLLSSIHNMRAGRPTAPHNNSGAAVISPTSPTQPPLIFDIGAWFDQQQPGERARDQSRAPVEPRSRDSSSEDESSKRRKVAQGEAKAKPESNDDDDDDVPVRCKGSDTSRDGGSASVDGAKPLLDHGKVKRQKSGNIQYNYGGKDYIPQRPHPPFNAKELMRATKHSSSDPSSFFPSRLRNLLERAEEDGLAHIFSWQPHGRAIKIHDKQRFAADILHRYLGRMKHESFTRQLNLWSFQRISSGKDKGAYYHPNFVRDQPELMTKMKRIRVKGTGIRQKYDASLDPDFYRDEAPFSTALHRLVSAAAGSQGMVGMNEPRHRVHSSMKYADINGATTANILASFASRRA